MEKNVKGKIGIATLLTRLPRETLLVDILAVTKGKNSFIPETVDALIEQINALTAKRGIRLQEAG